MLPHPPHLNAGNAGPFTLDGTRSFRVGASQAVLLDPGPDVDHHVRALLSWLADARDVRVVVTHGHADHAGAARRVADALHTQVWGPRGTEGVDHPLDDGSRLATDLGTLVAVDTPGHARHHLCFHWEERNALFAGDLLLGAGDTTWVGEYPGCVGDYLASLERVRRLGPDVVYPAHGEPLTDVPGALGRYERHRRARVDQVARIMEEHPGAGVDQVLEAVYGARVPAALEGAARGSVAALMDFVAGGAYPRGNPESPGTRPPSP